MEKLGLLRCLWLVKPLSISTLCKLGKIEFVTLSVVGQPLSTIVTISILGKLGKLGLLHCLRYRLYIILTLTFIQSQADLNRENTKCLIIPESVQTKAIKFAVPIVRLKVYIIFSQSDDLALHSRSQLHLKLDKCLTCTIIAISQTVFKLWHSNLA